MWCRGIGWFLGKFWLNLEISEEFLVVLEVSLSGDFEPRSLKFWNLFLTVLQSLEFVMLYWSMWSFQMRPFSSAALPLVREHLGNRLLHGNPKQQRGKTIFCVALLVFQNYANEIWKFYFDFTNRWIDRNFINASNRIA